MQLFQAVLCPAEVKQKLSPSPDQLDVEEVEVVVCIVHSPISHSSRQPGLRCAGQCSAARLVAPRRPALGSRVPACAAAGAGWAAQ